MNELDNMGELDNTMIIFTSDNGPTDWPFYYEEGYYPPGSTGPFFGRKWSLYEGGIRMPFIISWLGKIPEGTVDSSTVISSVDLFPSLCKIASATLPENTKLDGEDLSDAFFGNPVERDTDLYWYYVNDPRPGKEEYVSPFLAMRSRQWKLLMEPDGSDLQLFNLDNDIDESENLVKEHPDLVSRMSEKLYEWYVKTVVENTK